MVTQGQMLAELSNADLQLNVLARQTEVIQQINSMRSQELALNQTRLANERARIEADLATQTARRQYEMQRPLAERGFVSGRAFADSAATPMRPTAAAPTCCAASRAEDERLQSSQLAQLRASSGALNQSLGIARGSLEFAEPARAGLRPAHQLRHPGRPVAAARRAARPDRQRRPQQIARPGRRILSEPGQRGPHRQCRGERPHLPDAGQPRSIRRSATARSRSTCSSSARSRASCSAARPCSCA